VSEGLNASEIAGCLEMARPVLARYTAGEISAEVATGKSAYGLGDGSPNPRRSIRPPIPSRALERCPFSLLLLFVDLLESPLSGCA